MSANAYDPAELEHFLVSKLSKIIPQSTKDFWNEYRAALKKAEVEQLGNDEISDRVEMAGWGVKEAQEQNQAGASKFKSRVVDKVPPDDLRAVCFRPGNATRPSIRDSQEFHFHPRTVNGRRHTTGCQGSEVLGLANRQATEPDMIKALVMPFAASQ
jgi:hypothetical protein